MYPTISNHLQATAVFFTFRLFFLVLCVPFSVLRAQTATWPVQVSTNLLPPYSLYLSDYASGARERISVTLVNRDINRPGLSVRLRLTVKGQGFTIQTVPQAVFAPIVIDPNVPYRLSQQEIAPYFDPSVLSAQGLGTQSFRNDGKLPEGMLQFCFDVVEYHTGRIISQSGCGTVWMVVQKPPLLSLPFHNERVTVRDPLNLLFQWTPRHSGLAGVEYELIVRQLFDNNMAPEAAFAYSPEIVRERTKNTSMLYGAMMPSLTPGYRYAWAVRAVSSDGFSEQRVFENDGLSEIRVFSLEAYCPAVLGTTASYDKGVITVQWTPQMEHVEFTVAYRESGSDGEWRDIRTDAPPVRLTDIGLGREYEYRVGAACHPGNPIYGPTRYVSVPAQDTSYLADCGIAPDIDLSNKAPLENLLPGEQFMAYDFPVTVLTVSGGNGVFSGTGYTQMPGMFNFARYKLRFDQITINTDRRMIAGQCESISDPGEGQIADLDDILEGGVLYGIVKDGITKADVELDFTIDDNTNFVYDPATGTLTATTGDGKTHDIPVPAPPAGDQTGDEDTQPATFKELTVRDQDGNLYKVEQTDPNDPAKLTAIQIGSASETLTADNFNPKKLDYEQAVVTFRKGTGYYAFDTWQDYYEKAYLIRDKYENLNMIYRVPWKLLPAGKTDIIEATIEIADKNIDPANVVFKTPKGVEFVSKYENGVYTIRLVGGAQGDGQEIYATYKSGSQYLNFGKLSVASYAEQTYKVTIVPVNETDMDIAAIRQTLKDIYGPVGIHWEVSEEKGYSYFVENKFFEKNSGLLNSYTETMRAMNADFADNFKNGAIDPQTNYIFVLKYSGRAMERDAAGFMPRGGQFGYIFTKDFQSDDEILQTIAHELGHGKLLLKHTFDKDYGIAQGTTDNLMDYAQSKTHLAKWQWDVLADPGIAQGVFDRDEDGMVLPGILNIFDPNYKVAADLLVEHLEALGAKPIVTEGEKSIRVESVLSYAALVLNIDYTFKEDGDMMEYSNFLWYGMDLPFYDAKLVRQSGLIDKMVWKVKKWDDNFKKEYREKPPKVAQYVADMIMTYPAGVGPGTWINLANGEHYITGDAYDISKLIYSIGFSGLGSRISKKDELGAELIGAISNTIYEEITGFHKDIQAVNNMPPSVKDLTKYYIPKLFPAQYQDLFRAAGINPLDVVISIDAATYLKGDYNMYNLQQFSTSMDLLWKDFVTENPNATAEDILIFINSMIQAKVQTAFPVMRIEGLTIYLSIE